MEHSTKEKELSSNRTARLKQTTVVFCLVDSALGPDCTGPWLTNSLEFCRAAAAKNDRGEKAEEIIGFGCRERI